MNIVIAFIALAFLMGLMIGWLIGYSGAWQDLARELQKLNTRD